MRITLAVTVLVLGSMSPALWADGDTEAAAGQPQPADAPAKPWQKGVSQEQQDRAFGLFRNGNEHFVDDQCGRAQVFYRQALELWDHPAIRYNLGLCMLDLGGSAREVHEHFSSAVRFGAEPIGPDKFREARRYKTLLRARLAKLVVTCEQDGADVRLDGDRLFRAPGRRELLVEPGRHQVIATNKGYSPVTLSFEVTAGAARVVDVQLFQPGALHRPLPQWIPISLMAGGAVLVAAAIPLKLASGSNADKFDDRLATMCPTGCSSADLESDTLDLRSRSKTQDRFALTGFVVGGSALAAGVVLLVLNSPRRPKGAPSSAWIPRAGASGFSWNF